MFRRHLVGTSIALGVAAGIVFLAALVLGAALRGVPASQPLRLFASVFMADEALVTERLGLVVLVGLIAHLAISGIFGFIFGGIVEGNVAPRGRTTQRAYALLGAGFGLVLWLVNFQVFGRVIYPWFPELGQLYWAVMHTVFFGLPLGVLFGAADRTARRRVVPLEEEQRLERARQV